MKQDLKNKRDKEISPEIKMREEWVESVESFVRTGPLRRKLYSLMEIYHIYILNQHGHLPNEFDDMAIDVLDLCRFLRDLHECGKNMSEEEW
ncbi:hypothetical protein [Parachryseolinea silvisoli]|uniref:hypothetical protein n=1 Tax=Parachryseolinea silvisoli TaxID=2873601 RepID=UPI002265A641|nr:hypothetical protein [Parachryseolinea silvisoli]MCD9015246.1 hypothetical protein [Parachryseolinea silvisoli]